MSTMEKTVFIVLGIGILLSIVNGQNCPCNTGNGCNQNQNYHACGCPQNQNCYGGMVNNFAPPVSPACQSPFPCYDIVLNMIGDGRLDTISISEEREFLQPYSQHGWMRQQVIAEGRKAVAFFRDTYGVDFTSVRDEALLSGRRMNQDGIEFRPFRLNPLLRYRVYTATTRSESQLLNMPITEHGWVLNYTRPQWGRGTFRKLIPSGGIVLFGHYMFRPCGMPDMNNPRPCRNILNPQDPWAPIIQTYKCPTYTSFAQEPYLYIPVDCIFEHPIWGEGRERAIATIRDPEELVVDFRTIITYPSFK